MNATPRLAKPLRPDVGKSAEPPPQAPEPDVDLDRLVWDPEYRRQERERIDRPPPRPPDKPDTGER